MIGICDDCGECVAKEDRFAHEWSCPAQPPMHAPAPQREDIIPAWLVPLAYVVVLALLCVGLWAGL